MMSNKLGILKLACASLMPLKHYDNMYKRASVATISDSLLKAAGYTPMHKNAGMLGTGLTIGATALLTALLASKGNSLRENTGLMLNKINSDWGQGAVVARGNRGDMTPSERDRFFMSRMGGNKHYDDFRTWADNAYYAKAEAAKQLAKKRMAVARGNRYIMNGYNNADAAYANMTAGRPGFTYGPWSDTYRYGYESA